jgi:hypothetical protein
MPRHNSTNLEAENTCADIGPETEISKIENYKTFKLTSCM